MRILIAEDDRVSRRILETHLRKWDHDVVSTSNGCEAWDVLQGENPPRLAILDWMMPEMDGIEVCRRLREMDQAFTYVIMLTARDATQDTVTALESGADDFLSKPYNAEELRSRVGAGQRIVELQTRLEEANEKLTRLATTDSLTQISNRNMVLATLESELRRCSREACGLAVIMCDVDHFKSVNDRYGHSVGDEVLVEVAKRLTKVCRTYDMLGRYGGEEFLLVLPGAPLQHIENISHRFLTAVNGKPFDTESGPLKITISMGVMWLEPTVSTSSDTVIKAADALPYEAKHRGRDQFVTSIPDTEPDTLPHPAEHTAS